MEKPVELWKSGELEGSGEPKEQLENWKTREIGGINRIGETNIELLEPGELEISGDVEEQGKLD